MRTLEAVPPPAPPGWSPQDEAFFLGSLREVSRTFDFCIRVLPGRLRRPVALGYLLCRIADTLEDAPELAPERKAGALAVFREALAEPSPARAAALEETFRSIPRDAPDVRLGRAAGRVLAGLRSLPPEQARAMVPRVSELARGMGEYALRGRGPDGVARLKDLDDLDAYCYFVAGTVGEMLTDLFCLDAGLGGERAEGLRRRAVPFGQALQMVNIVKDARPDARRAWCFVPETAIRAAGLSPGDWTAPEHRGAAILAIRPVVARALERLRTAMEYLLLLPRRLPRIRLFCAWPLFMAAETLAACLDGPGDESSDVSLKIGRDAVARIRRATILRVFSNAAMRSLFDRTIAPLGAALARS